MVQSRKAVNVSIVLATFTAFLSSILSDAGMHRSCGAICHRRGHLTHLVDPNGSHGVDTRNAGLHPVVDRDVAVLQLQLRIQLGIGYRPGIDKDAAPGIVHGGDGAVRPDGRHRRQ